MTLNNAINTTTPFSVSNGGTGATTFTNHGVLLGQGTSPITAAAVGSSGQLFTSNGASSDPTFQAASGGGGVSTANSSINFWDDFIYGYATVLGGTNDTIGTWYALTSNSSNVIFSGTAVAGHPGIVEFNTSTSSNAATYFTQTGAVSNHGPILVGNGPVTITWYFNIPTLSTSSQRYIFRVGLGDLASGADMANGCYLEYTDNVNSGQWVMKTANASTRTATNSSTAVGTGWQVIQITVNSGGTSVAYSAGTTLAGLASIGTVTTNIPTNGVGGMIGITKTVGTTASVIEVDLCTMTYTLTTAR